VLDVIELLSRPESSRMRFSDVVRELDLTQGTAHTILKTLSDRGWIARDPATKTFALGPALSVVAARLDAARPLAHVARDAARRLVHTLDMPASVVERAGDDMLITAFERPANSGITATPHERLPYTPPFGVAFAAWDTPQSQQTWIDRGAAGDDVLAQRLQDVLTRTRERGYDIDWMTPALAQAAQAIGTLSVDALPAGVRPVVDQLRVEFASAGVVAEETRHDRGSVATVSAPVLDDGGGIHLILGVHPLRPMPIRDIEAIAKQLLAEVALVGAEARR
jgi:DNA-binding IclR family transcriptional regulator